MRRPFCRACILLALVLSLGLHWTVLQSAAWVGMVVSYSRDGSVLDAFQKTFDGKHPCPLCKLVARGTAEPNEGSDPSSTLPAKKEMKKIDLIAEVPSAYCFFATGVAMEYATQTDVADTRCLEPAVPPPERS